jgi:molybdenum cofactor cytidylyltransferase
MCMDNNLPQPAIPCIIPAAGRSSRMGEFKPLLPWRGTTLCAAVIGTVLKSGLLPVLVSGYRAEALAAVFAGRTDMVVVHNPDWEAGMVGSIQAGLRAALLHWPQLPGVLVAPADMPALPVQAFSCLASAGLDRSGAGAELAALFASRYGKLGHPVWIPAGFFTGILELERGGQLKPYLMKKTWAAVEVDSDAIFLDLDTPEDYRANTEQC